MRSNDLTCPFPRLYSIYNTAKFVIPALYTGTKKAIVGFGLITVPTFISYFGSNSHKLENGQEDIIINLSKSLMSMNLVSNIGQELSPILCGEYQKTCEIASRLGGFAIQTHTLNQTIETGIAKGAVYEFFGFSMLPFFASEAVGTIVEPVFSALHHNFEDNHTLSINTNEIVRNAVSKNLVNDQIVSQHIYSAMTCIFFPIIKQESPPLVNSIYYLYLLSDFNSTAAYETATNLLEDTKNYFSGDNSHHDEF